MVNLGGLFAAWVVLVVKGSLAVEMSMNREDGVHPVASAGILFFGYGSDEPTAAHFLEQATVSARRIKSLNPTVNISVVCNPGVEPPGMAGAFDMVVNVDGEYLHEGAQQGWGPKGVSRQWLTRLEYLARSPYEVTLALDSQALCCASDVADKLNQFRWKEFDIAFAVQGPRVLAPHNWAIMYRLNFNTRRLFQRWRTVQLTYGRSGSDQGTLFVAAGSLALQAKLDVGVLSPSMTMAPLIYNRTVKPYPKSSMLVDPHPVHFVHYPAESDEDADSTCGRLNSESSRARVVVLPKPPKRSETGLRLDSNFEMVYSEEELAQAVHAVRDDAEFFRGLDWENSYDKWGHVATPWRDLYPNCWEVLVKEVNEGIRYIYHNPENLLDNDKFVAEFGEDFLGWLSEP